MSEAEQPRSYTWALLILLGGVLLYALSCGPMAILLARGNLSAETFRAIYAPHVWVAERAPAPVGRWLEDYVQWWAGPPPPP
jgi:hypothetical protein